MKRLVEITGFIAPLINGALFALSGFIAPFGNAGDRMGPSFLIAGALISLSFAVGVHLHMRSKSSGAFGIFCGIAAGGISTLVFAKADLLGAAGYWQVMTAIAFSMAACAWSFRRASTESS
jgi:hypothetical protein